MVWTVTHRGESDDHATSNDLTIASFTPAADTLLIAVIAGEDGNVSGLTNHDGGGTWVEIHHRADGADWSAIWACITGSSPSASTVTMQKTAYTWNCTCTIFEVGGADVSGTVLNAFGTGVNDTNQGYDVRNHSVTLAAFSSSTNMVLGVIAEDSGTGAIATWEAHMTVETAGVVGTADYSVEMAWDDAEDTSVTCTVEDYTHTYFFAIEVKEASGGGPAAFPYHSFKYRKGGMNVLLTQ